MYFAGSLEARREKKAAATSFARQRDERCMRHLPYILCIYIIPSHSPEMRERDVLGGDERHQFNRLVAARKREQDIKVACGVFAAGYCPIADIAFVPAL